MNFFAHALLAARRRDEPRWLLGAMLPDLVSMAGLRLTGVGGEPLLAGGVDFHHRSDDAFHGAPLFVELMGRARDELEDRGLALGPAMAIGHVGVELLLDGYLVEREGVPGSYRAALRGAVEVGEELELAAGRGSGPEDPRARWRDLGRRMVDAPLPERYRESDFVAERLIRILARRPRLAVAPGRESEVYAWSARWAPQVAASGDALLEQVEARLAALSAGGAG